MENTFGEWGGNFFDRWGGHKFDGGRMANLGGWGGVGGQNNFKFGMSKNLWRWGRKYFLGF